MSEIIKHTFNKNHIEIQTIERPERYYVAEGIGTIAYIRSNVTYRSCSSYSKKQPRVTYERRVSPLGFYYDHPVYMDYNTDENNYKPHERMVVTYKKDGIVYRLKFIVEYNGQRVYDKEDSMRPWDLYPGDKDFPDHMLTGLSIELRRFFDNSIKIKWYNSAGDKTSLSDIRTRVYKMLFGHPDGPKFQTNEEKILAHGFDPKYSFRKDKEDKK